MGKKIKAKKGLEKRCKGWRQEGILRMLENTIENGEKPEELIIYAGSGKAARNWQSFDNICKELLELEAKETLVIQSGKPVGIFETSQAGPVVLMANTNLVPQWATWETFWDLEDKGLIMYGQYTAGSWAYIGTQGILQGTYETFAEASKQHFGGDLKSRLVLTAGLGGMGGAQPLAIKMNHGICLVAEVDPDRIEKRLDQGYLDYRAESLEDALSHIEKAKKEGTSFSIALEINAAELFSRLVNEGLVPDIVTDQTSAHDPLNGYIPAGLELTKVLELRQKSPEDYIKRSLQSMANQVRAMLEFKKKGAVVFEYGNNIRGQAQKAGEKKAFDFQGFVPLFIRPNFCIGRGPFRWVALSGDPGDIDVIDRVVLEEFSHDDKLVRWINMAREHVLFQGLPARICWMEYGGRKKLGLLINNLIQKGEVKGPVAITRDHLDTGSVAQPTRETENMRDGSDAIADWPLLNALLNTASCADLVAIHQGAGSGMGGSISAGMTLIADGTSECEERLKKVLTTDPGIGVIRHSDAGYEEARDFLSKTDLKYPKETERGE